jgi:hypothetical protein
MSAHRGFFGVHINKTKEEDDKSTLVVIFFGCIETKQDDDECRFDVVFFGSAPKKKKKDNELVLVIIFSRCT